MYELISALLSNLPCTVKTISQLLISLIIFHYLLQAWSGKNMLEVSLKLISLLKIGAKM